MTPKTRLDLKNKLKELAFPYEETEHPPLFKVTDSKNMRGTIKGAHTKNLFLKDKKGAFFLLVVDEDATINMKTMHKKLECGRLSFGKPELLMEKLGVTPGSVTAFSVINDEKADVQIILDETLMKNTLINCHPLTNEATITINSDDLIQFIKACGHKPLIMPLAETETKGSQE